MFRGSSGESRSASRPLGVVRLGAVRFVQMEIRDHASLSILCEYMVISDPRPSSLEEDAQSFCRQLRDGAAGERVWDGGAGL